MPPLPPSVVEHYRHPRNEGLLAPADAVGAADGRREGSTLRVSLRVRDGRIEAAGFTAEGDPSARAALSLVTTWLTGRALDALAALDPAAVGRALELPEASWPMLVPALEATEAALAALRGAPAPFAAEGPYVCKCLQVREQRIRRAIRRFALVDVEGVQHWTRACTGCRSCRVEVEQLLAQERARGRL